jgi:hypothetical protein
MWKAEDAAADIVRAVARRQREHIVTGHGKVIVTLSRWLPSLTAKLAERT